MSQKTPTQAFRSALRESVVILIAWFLCCCWVVGYCAAYAYPSTDDGSTTNTVATTLGFPTWVIWGIAVPWVVTNAFTIVFCFFMREDDSAGEDDA